MYESLLNHKKALITSLSPVQAGLGGAPKEAPRKGQRKIRPTVPVLATGLASSVTVPAAVSSLAAGEHDEAKQALQSTFLAMYSNSESKVRLVTVGVQQHS